MRLEKPSLWFLPVLVLTIAAALTLAWHGNLREPAAIILFIPLLWAYMSQPFRRMVFYAVLLATARLAVEAEQIHIRHGGLDASQAILEAFFPIALYVALGMTFYFYRRRYHRLTERLVLASAKEALADVSSPVAHDLNNVFTVIQGTAELMKKDPSLPPAVSADVKSIKVSALHGMELLSELRSMQQPKFSTTSPQELSEVVDSQLDLIQRILPQTIRVHRNLTAEPLMVRLNPSQFARVLTNLCLNARDAMPTDGELTVSTESRQWNGQKWAAVIVRDAGVGMDERTLRRVFDPFFTTKSAQGGTGLGLSISRTIVQAHGGHIEAQSQVGEGTTFTILLPLDSTS